MGRGEVGEVGWGTGVHTQATPRDADPSPRPKTRAPSSLPCPFPRSAPAKHAQRQRGARRAARDAGGCGWGRNDGGGHQLMMALLRNRSMRGTHSRPGGNGSPGRLDSCSPVEMHCARAGR